MSSANEYFPSFRFNIFHFVKLFYNFTFSFALLFIYL